MFKCIDRQSRREVISLDVDEGDARGIARLRELGREERLVCPGCEQPVRPRLGQLRRFHFAHLELGDCTHGTDSALLQELRAAIYRWLRSKFGERVDLERSVDGLPRPLDVVVEHEGREFAYWLVDRNLAPDVRETIWDTLMDGFAGANWIMARRMLRELEGKDEVALSTTERDFLFASRYDRPSVKVKRVGGSLHYLDPESVRLRTYRGLVCVHEPQVYRGRPVEHPMDEVLVSPANGELVHPGEHERLSELEAKARAREKRLAEKKAAKARRRAEVEALRRKREEEEQARRPAATVPVPTRAPTRAEPHVLELPEGTCVFCGEVTRDWWFRDGKTGACKCRSCQKRGTT